MMTGSGMLINAMSPYLRAPSRDWLLLFRVIPHLPSGQCHARVRCVRRAGIGQLSKAMAAIKWSDGHCFPASRLGSAQASSMPNGRALPRIGYKQPRGKASGIAVPIARLPQDEAVYVAIQDLRRGAGLLRSVAADATHACSSMSVAPLAPIQGGRPAFNRPAK